VITILCIYQLITIEINKIRKQVLQGSSLRFSKRGYGKPMKAYDGGNFELKLRMKRNERLSQVLKTGVIIP
jgi:hypothetical protein